MLTAESISCPARLPGGRRKLRPLNKNIFPVYSAPVRPLAGPSGGEGAAAWGASLLLRKLCLGAGLQEADGLAYSGDSREGPGGVGDCLGSGRLVFGRRAFLRIFSRLGIFRTGSAPFGIITSKMNFFPGPFQDRGKGLLRQGDAS
jgi:hypothetical protein